MESFGSSTATPSDPFMNKYFPSILWVSALLWTGCQSYETHFYVRTVSPIPLGDTIFVAGSSEALGGWNPHKVPLDRVNDSVWTISLKNLDKGYSYKFTLGTWQNEALVRDTKPYSDLHGVRGATHQHIIEKFCIPERASNGKITGMVQTIVAVKDKNGSVSARDVVIWLPPGYVQDKSRRYPVLYMHDGQNIFIPVHSSGGQDWKIDETMDSLITREGYPPAIVVGVFCAEDGNQRRKEYSNTPEGDAYRRYFIESVMLFVNETFRTLPGPENTMIGGSSMGGASSFYLATYFPSIFGAGLCFSPAWKVKTGHGLVVDMLSEWKKAKYPMPRPLYVDNGGVGLETTLQPGIDDFLKIARREQQKSKAIYTWRWEATHEHSEAYWAQRFPAAFVWAVDQLPENSAFKKTTIGK